ncbi:helix-turn-helix domain-containing protein [Novosphingobium sp. RL4]|uniref:helix-turn-helix transcriptional regulator n=1 Tax=Novosphingobium sp. RL4 TaxID=3109595 RepID=UPI002D79729B|nr:helix-turn-helix domain-containing protein [Novosphingobium sp. RL4]WRT94048.1 helix-turn-helix domain-containing protein [Novosphingobium sp. RL4]
MMLKPNLRRSLRAVQPSVRADRPEPRPAPNETSTQLRPEVLDAALAPLIADPAVTVPALLTPTQTAEVLGVGIKTLERWRSIGEGPRFVKLSPGTVRYRAVDLNTFVAERIKSNTLQ